MTQAKVFLEKSTRIVARRIKPKNDVQTMEFFGLAEAAEYLGVTKQVVCNWRIRMPEFPAPVAELALGPVWKAVDIRRWREEWWKVKTFTIRYGAGDKVKGGSLERDKPKRSC